MRRRNENEGNGNGSGHIKFRVVEFEIDGGNEMLAEGIKALTTALSKSSGTTTVVPQRALPPAKHTSATPVTEVETVEPETEETAELPFDEPEETTATPRARRPASPPPTPEVLSDIDLNSGKVSLKDYVAQKSPSGPFEMYATIAVWYKENHNLDEVNANRIYTAYRFLDEVPPNNVAQVLRQLKFRRWFDKGDSTGGYKINIVGMNKVQAAFK
jgi:hypothetical protein